MSIKWKIFAYLLTFVAGLLVLLYLFQVVFLDSFYKAIKTDTIKKSAETIVKNIDSADLDSIIQGLASQNEVCIRVVSLSEGADLYSVEATPECMIHKLSYLDLWRFYEDAKQNRGTVLELLSRNIFQSQAGEVHVYDRLPPKSKDTIQSMVYVRLVRMDTGEQVMVMLNSIISPVSATVATLQTQFLFIALILLLLSVGASLLLARKIAKPIVSLNRSAKELAKQNYDTRFDVGGYQEIAELGESLSYAAKELSKVEELRRELIANISHDLRTPLTMITGYGELMRDLPGENTPENVQIIIDEARRLTSLVNDTLDISKLQSGALTLNPEVYDLTAEIKEILTRYQKLTEQDGYHITFEAAMDVYVAADKLKLTQVIYNLINNAINYTGADKVVRIRQVVENGFVTIQIIDTGEGIAPDLLPYIWERYYRVDKTHKRAVTGTGLGLSIVKSLLDLHQARYGVESAVGKGSIFWFTLPLSPPPEG